MRLRDHDSAALEFAEAAAFYERRVAGLGTRFAEAIQRALAMIQKTPERWAKVDAEVRGCRINDFPYTIYYRILSDHIEVVAYKHHSRHPDYWQERLED